MKVLRVLPLVLLVAACSSGDIRLSPYRIDVQQGNALEQESVDKLKPGLTRSQVRFLLGTPLLVDPFHNNRWDYVFNFRKAGKLTEERRLALFFDGDVLARIEAEGFEPKGELPAEKPKVAPKPAETPKPADKPANPEKQGIATPAPVVAASQPAEEPKLSAPVAAVEAPKPAPAVAVESKPAAETTPVAAQTVLAKAASTEQRSLNETSIVQPLKAEEEKAAAVNKAVQVSEKSQAVVALQAESNVEAIKPDVMPEFPNAAVTAMPATPEDQVMAALNAWAKAWQARDEEAYLAAYAASFRPDGGVSRAEWEKRRRLLLGLARNIDVKIDGPAFESVGEDRAQVSFRQFYRSDSYQDAVIKLLKFVRVDNLWLIEEEKVLAPIKVKK